MTKRTITKRRATQEPPMYYAMLAPELPITAMNLEECFTAVPCFGCDDLVIDFPGTGLKIGTDRHAIVETNDKCFLIGPGIVFRTDESGKDIPITVDDIHMLQSLMVHKHATLHAGKYNISAIQLD